MKITLSPTQSLLTVSATPPDETGGWRVQFRRGSQSLGIADSAAPYTRTVTLQPGTYQISAVWTKSGQPTVTQGPFTVVVPETTTTLRDDAVPTPPVPTPVPVPIPVPTPVPVPVPTPGTASPDGTSVPPAAEIIDAAGAKWTLAGEVIRKNGTQYAQGKATLLLWKQGKVYARSGSRWFVDNGTGWSENVVPPGTPPTPPETPPETPPVVQPPPVVPPPGTPPPVQPPPPQGPPPTPGALLTPGDLTYLGKYLLPSDDPGAGTRYGYSAGVLTGRRVGNELRLFITGSQQRAGGGDYNHVGDAVYEMRLPAAVGGRCALVRNWGDVTQGKHPLRDTNQGPEIRGLQYINGKLWWAYGSSYFTGYEPDPSIGVSVLDDATGTLVAYGPWRTSEHSQKTRGYMVTIPDAFAAAYTGGRKLAVGAPPTSGNAMGPRGSCLFALEHMLALSTPADVANSAHVTLACQRLIYHDDAHPQERNPNYKVCGWKVLYDDAQGGPLDSGSPDFNNNSIAFDTLSAAAWVKTPAKEGVVFFGQITDVIPGMNYGSDTVPHLWYGLAGKPCRHGQEGGGAGTGPHSASEVPYLCIYDPAHLAKAAAGSVTPWGFPASSVARVNAISPGMAAGVTNTYMFGGAYFDPVSSVLFVSDIGGETLGELRPVIHAWRV